jgi:hypothetical protein
VTRSRRSSSTNIEAVWQRHGQALFALALVVCEDAEAAESVVVQAILDACTPCDIAVASVGRQELARYVYVLWQRGRDEQPGALGSGRCADADALASSGVAATAGLTHQQRSAIALALFGDHTYREIASLMELAPPDVADLMRTGLVDAGRQHR